MESSGKIIPKIGFISLTEPPRALSFADWLKRVYYL